MNIVPRLKLEGLKRVAPDSLCIPSLVYEYNAP